METRKFSLIIPTRERADTLRSCIKTAVMQTYGNLEIIISDNFSQDHTKTCVESFQDKRIRYINTRKRVSMTENWEFALSHATGDWVTILGDDDGLMPGCFESINALIHATQAQAVRSRACSFVWPSAQSDGAFMPLNVPLSRGWEIRSSEKWIKEVLRGGANYSELPMLYNGGFVDMKIIRTWMQTHTRFFNSRIPDVYSGLFLAHMLPSYVYFFEPVAVNGTSAHSTGFSQFRADSKSIAKSASPATQFAQEANLPFHPSVPLGKSGDIPKSILALIYESHAQVAQVVPQACALQASEQLKNILAFPGLDAQAMADWTQQFVQLHGLNLSKIQKSLKFKKLQMAVSFYTYRLSLVLNSYFHDDKNTSPTDVYAAAVLAAKIKVRRSAKLSNLIKNLWRTYIRLRKNKT